MISTQTYYDVLHLALTLPIDEQRRLVYAITDNIRQSDTGQNVRQRLVEYVEGGIDEIRNGRSFSNEEVLESVSQLIDKQECVAI